MDKENCIAALSSGDKLKIRNYLENEPDFGIFREGMLKLGGFTSKLDFRLLAEWLMSQTTKFGPEKIFNNLREFLNKEEIQGVDVLAINGITIDEPIELTNGIMLVPFTDLPDSAVKAHHNPLSIADTVDCPEYFKQILLFQKIYSTNQILPSAALLCSNSSKPPFLMGSPPIDQTNSYESLQNELINVCTYLTLAAPCSPTPVAFWWEPREWVPKSPWEGFGSGGWSFDLINQTNRPFTDADKQKAKKILSAYLQIDDEFKLRLKVPLDRLNRAIRRSSIVDKAIELGIAIETVFLDKSDNIELSYKIRQRAAWLLGADIAERAEISQLFNKLYKYRSKAVHSGKLDGNKKNIQQDLHEGITKVSAAVEIIMYKKEWPNWEKLTLGELN